LEANQFSNQIKWKSNGGIVELREKIRTDYQKGKRDEGKFADTVISYGYECLKPSKSIDIYERWDYLIKKNGKKARVQVKGGKNAHKCGYTWIELTKDDGTIGWLYGKADVLALMLPDRFDFYLMSSIRELIEKRVDKSLPVLKAIPKKENGENDYYYMRFRQYNGYNRRDDTTVIVSFEDIKEAFIKTMKITED